MVHESDVFLHEFVNVGNFACKHCSKTVLWIRHFQNVMPHKLSAFLKAIHKQQLSNHFRVTFSIKLVQGPLNLCIQCPETEVQSQPLKPLTGEVNDFDNHGTLVEMKGKQTLLSKPAIHSYTVKFNSVVQLKVSHTVSYLWNIFELLLSSSVQSYSSSSKIKKLNMSWVVSAISGKLYTF